MLHIGGEDDLVKFNRMTALMDSGGFTEGTAWRKIHADVRLAVRSVDWPPSSGVFTIFPESGKKSGMGNGVVPIKAEFIQTLVSRGWLAEQRQARGSEEDEDDQIRPGAFDARLDLTKYDLPPFVVEWETGNISSSHRAVNKITLGIFRKELSGGLLVLPSRKLAKYLTDRIGNYQELRPYFALWRYYLPGNGYLGVIEVEQDAESLKVPKIPKMTAGRALR